MMYALEKEQCQLVMMALTVLIKQIHRNTWDIRNELDSPDEQLLGMLEDAEHLKGLIGANLMKEAGENKCVNKKLH